MIKKIETKNYFCKQRDLYYLLKKFNSFIMVGRMLNSFLKDEKSKKNSINLTSWKITGLMVV